MNPKRGKWVGVLAVVAALTAASCGQGGAAAPEPRSEEWRRIPAGPLSPREGALGLWTGDEVLLIGGSDARPCPPAADCVPPEEPPLADGAAYHPGTGKWRKLTPAPVRIGYADGVLVDGTAYLWVPGRPDRPDSPRAFLAYDVEHDRWRKLPEPPGGSEAGYRLVAAGDKLVLHTGSDEEGEKPDLVYDPAKRSWSELPDDPLSPSFDRFMVWTGDGLVLFEHKLVPNPGAEKPSVTRAAVLDLEAGAWRRLPDSEVLDTANWLPAGDRLVNPTLGTLDGGGDWDRPYPNGGVLDVPKGEWSALPDPPASDINHAGGALTADGGHYLGDRGWVLDTGTDSWIRIPALDVGDDQVQGRTVVSAGTDLFVFGGARFADADSGGELVDEAFSWSPRR